MSLSKYLLTYTVVALIFFMGKIWPENFPLAMGGTNYPCVPGHELAGIVTEVGKNVLKYKVKNILSFQDLTYNEFQVGDRVGVGCIVDSCMQCNACKDGEEHLCDKGVCFIID